MEVLTPRVAKPWFKKKTNWWCTDITGRRYKLLQGVPGDARRKTPPNSVMADFHRLMAECAVNPPADSGPEVTTVPAIIDEYLDVGCRENQPRTFQEKKAILQKFARDHRDRLAAGMKPYDLQKWIVGHPDWNVSDLGSVTPSQPHVLDNGRKLPLGRKNAIVD